MWHIKLTIFIFTQVLPLLIFVAAKPTKLSTFDEAAILAREQVYWEQVNKTCLSHYCDDHVNLKHLKHIATHMNRAINPCDNFHAYACSNWRQQYAQHQTALAVGEQQLIDKYDAIFQPEHYSLLGNNLIMRKLYKYFGVCLQSERSEKASWLQYINTLRSLGYLQESNNTNWLQILRELNKFSNSRFFISLQIERFNNTRYMLSIYPHNLMERVKFSVEIYEILKIYTNHSYIQIAKDFKNLELDLENILNTSCLNTIVDEKNDCDLSEWLSYEDLLKSNSSLNWEYLLADFPLNLSDQIYINDFSNLKKVKNYLDHSSQKMLFLYAIARFVNYMQSHNHNIVDKGSGRQSCLRHMRKHFPLAMNYLYERVYYGPIRKESDAVIEQVFYQLKKQFSLILDSNEMHFSLDSLQYLKKKLSHLQLNIGNLPKNVSGQFYLEYIKNFNITNNFYVNHLKTLQHFFQKQRLLASRSKFEDFWFTFNLHMPNFLDNLDSTPYYFSTANFIILPFAYLQLPFYDHRFWPSLLFGDLATTLSHELIHAFDSKFLENDFAGNYNEKESSAIINNQQFQKNIACLSKEPTKYLTERIADTSGTHLALKTFIKDSLFLKHNGKLFFLQFAQFFCGSSKLELFALEDSSHDLDSLRLNYTLSHMPEFAQVFQCPLGSPMNPVEKCKLW